jgi:hypothetical protein
VERKLEARVRSLEHQRSEDIGQRIQPENQRTEAVRPNQEETGQLNHKVVGWSIQKRETGRLNQKVRGWTVKPEGGWTVKPEDQRREDLGLNEGENNEVE